MISSNLDDALPALGWVAEFKPDCVTLFHGPGVETRSDGWFEGAWDGAYREWAFATSTNVFGSGALISSQAITIVSPSHTLEALYLISAESRLIASNSLPLIMVFTQASFLPTDFSYGARFASVVRGIKEPVTWLPLPGGGKMAIVHFANVVVSKDLSWSLERKRSAPNFQSYHAYVDYLLVTLSATVENAMAAARMRAYKLLTTISSGYDSPACAALAQKAGCREGITFADARGGQVDSGQTAAAALGIDVCERTRPASDQFGPDEIASFFCTGMQGEDSVFWAFRDILPGSLFVTGFHGDKVWERRVPPSAYLKRGDISGASLGYFRISLDFIHLPLPFVGVEQHKAIWQINNSEEMAPWSIGDEYDRPIPRRIAEEAGVPRTAIGQSKRAISFLAFQRPYLLSQEIRQSVTDSCFKSYSWFDQLRYNIHAATFDLVLRGGRARSYTIRFLSAIGRWPGWEVFEHSHPINTALLLWATEYIVVQMGNSDLKNLRGSGAVCGSLGKS